MAFDEQIEPLTRNTRNEDEQSATESLERCSTGSDYDESFDAEEYDALDQPPCKPYIAFLTMFSIAFTVIGFNLLLLFGLVLYPKIIGLYFLLPYYFYTLFICQPEMGDGGRWLWFTRNFTVLRVLRRYLQISFVINEKLLTAQYKQDAQFLFAVFPHGSNADFRAAIDGMLFDALPHIASSTMTLAATVLFRIPLVREIALWTGCVDARRSVAEQLLKRKRSLMILPGGQAEQIRTISGREIIVLRKRKGFLKLAMKHGVPVVPVYAFGVSDYYRTSSIALGFRDWLRKTLGISIPIARGLYGTLISPLPVPTTIVFGEPISFVINKAGSPSPEEIDNAHDEFCKALQNLFDSNKKRLGYGDRTLEIE